jgi:hypothetical protein
LPSGHAASERRSNISFNPTGNSAAFIENLAVPQLFPGGLIRALGFFLVAKGEYHMRRHTTLILVALFIVIQFFVALWWDDRFTDRVNKSIEVMEQRMVRDSVPDNQIQAIHLVLQEMGLQVSSYIQAVRLGQFTINALLLVMLYKGRKEGFQLKNEA